MADVKLSPEEETAAARTAIHVVWYVFTAEDDIGNDITWGIPLTMHATAAEADIEAARRTGIPPVAHAGPNGHYVRDGPVNLLAFGQCGFVTADEVRAVLRRAGPVAIAKPGRWYSPGYYVQYLKSTPLTAAESKQASAIQVWTIYYEDRFHFGAARESYPVAICLSKAEAEAELERRGRPVESGGDGYLIEGPSPLAREGAHPSEVGADVVREVVRRVEACEPGPVMVR